MFSSRDSQQTADLRYIEVYRGYSPTLEFDDDNPESLERTGISLNVFSRGERSVLRFTTDMGPAFPFSWEPIDGT